MLSRGTELERYFLFVPSFGPVAPYYDELMKTVPYRMWVGYYQLLLSQQGIRPKRILEACCGTGTLCEILSKEGYEMAGFDLSAEMIAEAKSKARKLKLDIQYTVADAAHFYLGEMFDAAFSFFDSLNYIIEPARLQSALHSIGQHLKPGGSFIFDLNTAYAFEQKMFDQKNLRTNSKLRYDWHGDFDKATRIIRVEMKFWRDGEEFEEVHVQRAYAEEEVRAMLKNAGFEEVRAFNSYTLDPVRATSDRIHYSCIKV
jgi:SAM-dependent methyltransferase